MENLKFSVGDNVKIVSNDLQPEMVGKIGRIKKVYPSFSEDSDNNIHPSYFYRVEVGGTVLKGIATNEDLKKCITLRNHGARCVFRKAIGNGLKRKEIEYEDIWNN